MELVHKPLIFPTLMPKANYFPRPEPLSMEVDSDSKQLEFRRMKNHTEFRLQGKRNDDNSVSLTLRITDLHGE